MTSMASQLRRKGEDEKRTGASLMRNQSLLEQEQQQRREGGGYPSAGDGGFLRDTERRKKTPPLSALRGPRKEKPKGVFKHCKGGKEGGRRLGQPAGRGGGSRNWWEKIGVWGGERRLW